MPQQTIYFDKEEDEIIERYQKENGVSKADAVKQIVRQHYRKSKKE